MNDRTDPADNMDGREPASPPNGLTSPPRAGEPRKAAVLGTIERAQALAKKYVDHPGASVDAFLTNRRQDSGE